MRRVSILGMMGLILALAVILAALRDANDYWASGLYLATAVAIGVAAIGAFHREGKQRAARLGFAIFAGGYFALAFFGASEAHSGRLPTSWLMSYIHRQVAPLQPVTFQFVTTGSSTPAAPTGPYLVAVGNGQAGSGIATTTTSVVLPTLGSAPDEESANRWRSLFPGAANPIAFATVGHCLFTLLAGSIGMGIALWSRSRAERTHSSPS